MKISLILLFLAFLFVFGVVGNVLAQSATSTVAVATPTAAATSTVAVQQGPTDGMPEWGPDYQTDVYIWGKTAAAIIRAAVSQLPATATLSLPMPILFGVAPSDLTPNYGDPRGTGRFHEGEDIMAPKDALIVTPTPAVMLSAGYGADSGYYVTTANPGGETFVYMHLDRVAPLNIGSVLPAGSLLGFVGNTGNAAGGATLLHFEIHKNGATDPYLRLKSEFTPAQKMAFLTNILAQTADKTTLAKFIVATYPAQIAQAKTAGIVLPSEIAAQMPQVATAAPGGPITTNLGVGARGSDVVSLQTFLIIQNKGPAAVKLAAAGATGYFGALTQAALAEYQTLAAAGAPAQMTREQIMSKIAQIQALIAELQQQLKLLQTND